METGSNPSTRRSDVEVTLAIPFYRDLAYLRDAIESVVAQRSPHWRLLVCDDGAVEPGARELVEQIVGDEHARYVRNERNLGMVANWNRCLDEADTPLVSLLHADDRLQPDYVERMAALAQRHPECVAFYCGARVIDAAGRPRFSLADRVKPLFEPPGHEVVLEGEAAVVALTAGNFIMCPTLCFRVERLAARRFDPRWQQVQDLDLTTRLLMEGERIAGTREVSYDYRRHARSATHQQSESRLRFDEEFALFDEIADRAAARGWHEAAGVARRKRIVKLHLLYRSVAEAASLHPLRAASTLAYLARRSRGHAEGTR